jgi:calcineurin-like phosphoesterase family protein
MYNRFKKEFWTSDWHIGHANSIMFDDRPFRDLDHMHTVLVNNYNASVGVNDICFFLGDAGLASGDTLEKVIKRLNGLKVLVIGNHDKGVNSMYMAGFDLVLYGAVTYIANHRVTMSHCPLKGVWREDTSGMKNPDSHNWHGENRKKHSRLTFTDEEQFHLHGHIHSNSLRPNKSKKIADKQFDVGLPANNYRPVSRSELESWIVRYERENKQKT